MNTIDLAALYPVDDGDLTRLHARLAAAAERDDVLDVAYRTVDSPVGPLLIAATPVGLVRVAFDSEGNDAVLQSLSDRISSRVLNAPGAPRRRRASAGRVFLRTPSHLRCAAGLATVQGISPHGARASGGRHRLRTTASYGTLARLSGSPKAVRAVGTTCATNPIPVVVPCHRVVRADGTMGQYRGGPAAKRTLLDLEGAE